MGRTRSSRASVRSNRLDAMTGNSTVAVLYRGVFVQEFEAKGLWGIEGSIDVDPKHFKPRLNRESFVEGQFQTEVKDFLKICHPAILEALVKQLKVALERGALNKWTEKRWANLWLSLPRVPAYAQLRNCGMRSFGRCRPSSWRSGISGYQPPSKR